MKKLFKNSFLSFLGSKLAMILLSLTVFLSIAVFTMLSSTSWAFDSSYNQVVQTGRLHDFTVNEKYTIQGQTGISYKSPKKVETIYEFDNSKITDKKWQTTNSDFSSLFKITKIIKNKNNTTKTLITPEYKINFKDSVLVTDKATNQLIGIDKGFSIDMRSGNANTDPFIGNISISNQAKKNDVRTFSDKTGEYEIVFLKDYSDIQKVLIDKIITPNKLTKPTQKIKVGLNFDWNTMSGDYAKSLKITTNTQQNDANLNKILDSYGISDVFIYWNNPWTNGTKIDSTFISSLPTNDREKLVRMKSTAETAIDDFVSKARSQQFIDNVKHQFGDSIAKNGIKSVESIYINSGKQQFKMVNVKNDEKEVDKLVLFKGNKPENAMLVPDMRSQFEKMLSKWGVNYTTKNIQSGKEYKITFDDGFGKTASFIDPSSYQAVITDGYAKEHNILPIPQTLLKTFNEEVLKLGLKLNRINDLFKDKRFAEYVHYVDSTPYIITGVGTTPDFSFPIINQQNPLPNSNTQAILFTNDHGYKRITDAFRGNQKENYLAFKFKDGISEKEQKTVVAGISNIANKMMSWGNAINPVSTTFDTNEKIILAPQRIAFLKKLKLSITTITFLTTTFLAILTAFIILMVIKKQISSKKKILGTLLANGYTKNQIAWSMTSIALIIIVIPALMGYVVGHFMQSAFINMFTNYWTLPIYNDSFSWVTLLIVVALPTIVVAIFAYIVSRMALKGNLIEILNSSQSKTAGWLTSKVLKPFAWVGVKSKITISLFTSNMSKMALVFVTTTIAMVAGGIAFSIMGRFNYALETSKTKVNYTFKVDMASSTYEGGLMNRINPNQFGMKDGENWNNKSTSDAQDIFKESLRSSKSYFHVPGPKDLNERWSSDYLKNRMQFKSMLNFDIPGVQNVNPWNSALALMPENQRNIANKQEKEFVEALLKWFDTFQARQLFTQADIQKIQVYADAAKANGYEFDATQIKDQTTYRKFIFAGLKEQIYRYDNNEEYKLPYFISYNNITTDNDDELYTHLDIDYKGTNLMGNEELIQTTITGINPNTRMINFDDGLLDKFKKFKYDVTRDNDQIVPIIINTYFKEAYGVKVGDTIDFSIKNRADRFHMTHNPKAKAMVIGVQESYDGPKLYTTQSIANAKLGWTDPVQNKKAFNGVYTTREKPMIFQNISLYSVSGIYPGTDTIDRNNTALMKNIDALTKKFINPRVAGVSSYLKVYSNSPYISTFSSANWAAMSNYAFTNILDLSGKLIWMVESIAIFIALLFVAIIASMIISDNKKFISTMKVLGYRNKEIRSMFFRSLIPAIIIGLLVAIPITISALLLMKAVIISFGAVLVPIHMMGWELILTFFLITFAFAIIYYVSMRKLGNEEMLEAFKE